MKLETNEIICLRLENPDAFESCKTVRKARLTLNLLTQIKHELIEKFNNEVLDASKIAIIEVAKEHTLFELAAKMEEILAIETAHAWKTNNNHTAR